MPTNRPTDATSSDQPPVEDLSYEQAREELVTVVARLETGGETLEGALALWERGEALAARCQEWLDGARARLDAARDGDKTTEPADETKHTDAVAEATGRPPDLADDGGTDTVRMGRDDRGADPEVTRKGRSARTTATEVDAPADETAAP